MTPSIRGLPGTPGAPGTPAALRRLPHDNPAPVPDPPMVNVAVQAAIAGSTDAGVRVQNPRAAMRGTLAASNALGALARYVRMRLTDEADLSLDETDGADALRTPWGDLGLATAAHGRAAGAGAGDTGQPRRPRAGEERGAVVTGPGSTAPIAPVRAGAPVRRVGARRGSTAWRIIGWGFWLAAVIVLSSTLMLVMIALKRAVDDLPGAYGPPPCERAPQSCRK